MSHLSEEEDFALLRLLEASLRSEAPGSLRPRTNAQTRVLARLRTLNLATPWGEQDVVDLDRLLRDSRWARIEDGKRGRLLGITEAFGGMTAAFLYDRLPGKVPSPCASFDARRFGRAFDLAALAPNVEALIDAA